MNKKLFLGMFAASGMLLATSCSQDELGVMQSGNEAQVTLSLGLEGGLATRAISDGESADYLVYAVYKYSPEGKLELQKVTGANVDKQLIKENAFANGLTDQVTVTLAKGQRYKVVFWAQDADCEAYTTNDLEQVKVNYEGINNDETRDAFFGTVDFNVNGDEVINDIILKRPFAQINVGVHQKDWTDAVASGIEITESTVEIKNVADQINLLTGKVGGQVDITYDWKTIPAQFETGEEVLTVDGTAYKYLSMSYILANDTYDQDTDQDGFVGDAKTTVESLNFTFSPESGNDINLHDGLYQVPVQRNWRTNILGTILTGDVQLNIKIDPIYEGDYNPYDQLQEVLANGGKITLFDDIELTEELTISEDTEIDLNKNTLTVKKTATVEGNLKIKNGVVKIEVEDEGEVKYGFNAQNGSTVDLEDANVEVVDGNVAVMLYDVKSTVNVKNTTMVANGTTAFAIGSFFGGELTLNVINSKLTGTPALNIMMGKAHVTMDESSSIDEFLAHSSSEVTVIYAGEKPVVKTDGTANTVNYYVRTNTAIKNKEGVRYEGDFFASGYANDALYLNNCFLEGDATVYVERTYGAVILEDVKGNLNGDAIYVNNTTNSVMVLQNCDFTLAEGKKLIKSVNTIYQVFMANITINGEKLTQESAAKYLENVGWYQIVDEI